MNGSNGFLPKLSSSFNQRLTGTFGKDGALWLDNLPFLLEEASASWSLSLLPPFSDLSYNYVASAICADGSEAVLKAGVPNQEIETEIESLQIYDGQGIVRLLKADAEKGLLLLERLNPGRALLYLDDDRQATRIACKIMKQLHQSAEPQSGFPTVADWFQRGFSRLRNHFDGGTGPFPKTIIEAAEGLSQDLLASMAEPVLLHGDLHHWNILSAERQDWLAIDPKGIVGEPVYETGAWLRNPSPLVVKESRPEILVTRRVDQFADELGFDRRRILGWGFAQAILSAWWSYEDGDPGWEEMLSFAEAFPK
jgi:streptomycin 6-kinase